MRASWGALVLLAAPVACGDDCLVEAPEGTTVRFEDPQGMLPDFLAHPFPSDGLVKPSGLVRFDHFPNRAQSSTLDDYLGVFSTEVRAFSVTSPIFVSFTGPVAPTGFNPDTVQLIDVDDASPERGRRFPLGFAYEPKASAYLAENHVAFLPPEGATLRGGTTYALVITDDNVAGDGAPLVPTPRVRNLLVKGCEDPGPGPLSTAFAELRSFLDGDDLDGTKIVGATVFTTQNAVADLRRLAAVARALPAPTMRSIKYVVTASSASYYSAELDLPGFQSGRIPYRALGDGGSLARDESGAPRVDHQETTRIGWAIPRGEMPQAGWPLVIYSHGTGGDYRSAFDPEVADRLASQGIAVLGYDQTLHGPRDPTASDPNLTFFNLFNPVAARDNVLQGAADLVVLTTFAEQARLPSDLLGYEVHFDPSRLGFLGHSQGSLVGAPFLAADPRIKGTVFSGLGAILSITLQERKDIVDFEALLTTLLSIPEGEALDDYHPVLALIQSFIEPADPIAYARSLLDDPPEGASRDFLMVEGFLDFASPARGQEAFATAARFPVVAPLHRLPKAAAVIGPPAQSAPATDNVSSKAGSVTAGLLQYPGETHFPIFENADANRRYVQFLKSVLIDGQGTIPE